MIWLRAVPSLLVMSIVVWCVSSSSQSALRLRVQLRMVWVPIALLLGVSAVGLVLDAPLPETPRVLLAVMAPVLALILPAALVVGLLEAERSQHTLNALVASPRAARVFGEKWAIAGFFIAISWLQLSPGLEARSPLWWLALAGHTLPLATAMPWFLLSRNGGATLGFTLSVPALVGVVLATADVSWEMGALMLTGYAIACLCVLPLLARRGIGAPTLEEMIPRLSAARLRRVPPLWAAEVVSQADAIACAVLGLLAYGGLRLAGFIEAPAMVLWLLSIWAAALSPALSFAQARSEGTLEPLLALQTRARVFGTKAIGSLVMMILFCVVAPLVALGVEPSRGSFTPWALSMFFAWAVSLAVSVRATGAGVGVGLAVLLTIALAAMQVGVQFAAWWLIGTQPSGVLFAASFVVIALMACALARRSFVTASNTVRELGLALASSLVLSAAICFADAGVT